MAEPQQGQFTSSDGWPACYYSKFPTGDSELALCCLLQPSASDPNLRQARADKDSAAGSTVLMGEPSHLITGSYHLGPYVLEKPSEAQVMIRRE